RPLLWFAVAVMLVSVSVDGSASVAQATTPGSQLWAKRYNGPSDQNDRVTSLAVSPDGTRVFVTGSSAGSTSSDDNGFYFSDYATVAYDATTGDRLWRRRYNGPADYGDSAQSIGVSPDATKVFVTGASAGS